MKMIQKLAAFMFLLTSTLVASGPESGEESSYPPVCPALSGEHWVRIEDDFFPGRVRVEVLVDLSELGGVRARLQQSDQGYMYPGSANDFPMSSMLNVRLVSIE